MSSCVKCHSNVFPGDYFVPYKTCILWLFLFLFLFKVMNVNGFSSSSPPSSPPPSFFWFDKIVGKRDWDYLSVASAPASFGSCFGVWHEIKILSNCLFFFPSFPFVFSPPFFRFRKTSKASIKLILILMRGAINESEHSNKYAISI